MINVNLHNHSNHFASIIKSDMLYTLNIYKFKYSRLFRSMLLNFQGLEIFIIADIY
jgi:hypothetical protein